MRKVRLIGMCLVALVLLLSTRVEAGKRGGGDGRINKLSGPTMLTNSLYYRFAITTPPEIGASLDYDRDRLWLSLSAGFGRSIDNNLDYPADMDKSTTVKVLSFEPAIEYSYKSVEFGAGYLFNLFYGEAFPAFGRDALDLELGWRPFGRGSGLEGLERSNLKISVLATYYYDGITGGDFGALPGSFEVDSDLVWGFQVSYDFF